MNRLLCCLLIFTTLWMATWLLTDVHVVHAAGDHQLHPLFSMQPEAGKEAVHGDPGDDSCHFCSYDHGGHVGGMALPPDFTVAVLTPPDSWPPPYRSHFSPLIRPPTPRPPIV
ncbi:hypothetical protein MIN45_P0647 [Methylomarinovum tepidoasis]|uniref:DUF2946 domain-containing protein n=1 Tax=Methylomarinovum tepidoasis TaxID=2840183 RepID=A0AAU9CPQ2_9GAMM|nr:hypothetical protein [Methylomarinovum sp. IN45]BCX88278.1 hypothetical protein MIN45_P0647 [Methylomarinovum sp. IN45]